MKFYVVELLLPLCRHPIFPIISQCRDTARRVRKKNPNGTVGTLGSSVRTSKASPKPATRHAVSVQLKLPICHQTKKLDRLVHLEYLLPIPREVSQSPNSSAVSLSTSHLQTKTTFQINQQKTLPSLYL